MPWRRIAPFLSAPRPPNVESVRAGGVRSWGLCSGVRAPSQRALQATEAGPRTALPRAQPPPCSTASVHGDEHGRLNLPKRDVFGSPSLLDVAVVLADFSWRRQKIRRLGLSLGASDSSLARCGRVEDTKATEMLAACLNPPAVTLLAVAHGLICWCQSGLSAPFLFSQPRSTSLSTSPRHPRSCCCVDSLIAVSAELARGSCSFCPYYSHPH